MIQLYGLFSFLFDHLSLSSTAQNAIFNLETASIMVTTWQLQIYITITLNFYSRRSFMRNKIKYKTLYKSRSNNRAQIKLRK